MMEANAIEIRLRNHEVRIDANHDSLAKLRDTTASHETRISVVTTELRETREDIVTLTKALAEDRKERRVEGEKTRRAFYAAAAFLATFSVSIIGLIAVLVGSH